MNVEIVSTPALLRPHHLAGRCVVIFDVLRATSTMAAALNNGAREIRVFAEIDAARAAAGAFEGERLLVGERGGVLIDGFDLGNSPLEMTQARIAGRTLFMTTTNGTRAIVAARGASRRLAAGLVNLSATAERVRSLGLDVTLLAAGVPWGPTGEDDAGAGAMAAVLRGEAPPPRTDEARIAAFRETPGGSSLVRLNQLDDLEFCATVDRCAVACEAVMEGEEDVVRRV